MVNLHDKLQLERSLISCTQKVNQTEAKITVLSFSSSKN